MKSTSDIVQELYAEHADDFKNKEACSRAVKATFELIASMLESGEDVRLHGFGSFCVKERAARKGHNPMTGESLDVPAKKVVRFKAATTLGERVK